MVKGILLGCLAAIVAGMAIPRQAVAFDVGVGPFSIRVPEGGGYGRHYGHSSRHGTQTAKKKGEEAKGEEVEEQPKAASVPKQTTEVPARAEPSIPAGHGPDLTPER
jgi:hypothetical protein